MYNKTNKLKSILRLSLGSILLLPLPFALSCSKKVGTLLQINVENNIVIKGIDGQLSISFRKENIDGEFFSFKEKNRTNNLSYGNKVTIISKNNSGKILNEWEYVISASERTIDSIRSQISSKYNNWMVQLLDSNQHMLKNNFITLNYNEEIKLIDSEYLVTDENGNKSKQTKENPLSKYEFNIGDLRNATSRKELFDILNDWLFVSSKDGSWSDSSGQNFLLGLNLDLDFEEKTAKLNVYKEIGASNLSTSMQDFITYFDNILTLEEGFDKYNDDYWLYDTMHQWVRWDNKVGTPYDDPEATIYGSSNSYSLMEQKYRMTGVLKNQDDWNNYFGPWSDRYELKSFLGNSAWHNIDYSPVKSQDGDYDNYLVDFLENAADGHDRLTQVELDGQSGLFVDGTNTNGNFTAIANWDDIIRVNLFPEAIDYQNGIFKIKFTITKGGEVYNGSDITKANTVDKPIEEFPLIKTFDVLPNGNRKIDENKREEYRKRVKGIAKELKDFTNVFQPFAEILANGTIPGTENYSSLANSVLYSQQFLDLSIFDSVEIQDKYIKLLEDSNGCDAPTFLSIPEGRYVYFDNIWDPEDDGFTFSPEFSPAETKNIYRCVSTLQAWSNSLREDYIDIHEESNGDSNQ